MNINFCFKTDKRAIEKHSSQLMVTMLSLIHGFFNGVQDFGTCENPEDDEHSGQPIAIPAPYMIKTVREFISTNRLFWMMEEEQFAEC